MSLNLFKLISRILTPSIEISPSLASKYLGIKWSNVDLPLPVLPIIAVVFPASASKLILLSTGLSAPSNVKLTLSNLRVPFTSCSLLSSMFSLSTTVTSVANTSFIRPAATSARGSCIIKNVKNKNDITICIVYVINAIISPTWILPASIFFPPTQIINNAPKIPTPNAIIQVIPVSVWVTL